ncbi:hypothetical protein, partial [Pseudonocardia sp. SID8383]|uniref:hypothetical protein n=1 Tax=Pseudonocardia sp. SID8383 TaxID=2690363 RepID=UPI00137E2DFE
MALVNPGPNDAGSAGASPRIPAIAGTAATASRPAARAIALLTPDATPACRSAAASSTAVVSGATA